MDLYVVGSGEGAYSDWGYNLVGVFDSLASAESYIYNLGYTKIDGRENYYRPDYTDYDDKYYDITTCKLNEATET